MNVLFMGNNRLGCKVLECLCRSGENIVALVLHPDDRRTYGDEILAVKPDGVPVFDGSTLDDASVLDEIASLDPEIGVSALFGYILKPSLLDVLRWNCVNLHPGLLPYNRGAHPNVWPLIDGTPAGVTLHYIDAGIDTGDVIAQREVRVAATDTAETLYRRLERAGLELFAETWPLVRDGKADRVPQQGEGTYHRVRDLEEVGEIDLDRRYRAADLLNILRARTFRPHPGARFTHGGETVFAAVRLGHDPAALWEEDAEHS